MKYSLYISREVLVKDTTNFWNINFLHDIILVFIHACIKPSVCKHIHVHSSFFSEHATLTFFDMKRERPYLYFKRLLSPQTFIVPLYHELKN